MMNTLTNVEPQIRPPPSPERPLLSIVVTSYTKRRLKDLIDLINSIKLQSYSNIETIIVIEKSKNLYYKINVFLAENAYQFITLIFSSNTLGISEARNLGIKHARGNIIAFTDDDAVLFPNWAEEIVKTFAQQDDIVGVTGPAFPLWENKSLEWFPEEFYWIIGCTAWRDWKRETNYGWGVNMAFRREAFDVSLFTNCFTKGAHDKGKVGPVGDDREFILNVRRKTNRLIIYNPSAKVWHKVRKYKTVPRFVRRYAYWQGYSDALFKSACRDVPGRLNMEFGVLRRIISRLLPSILAEFTTDQGTAWRRLRTTAEVAFFFLLGYASYILRLVLLTRKIV